MLAIFVNTWEKNRIRFLELDVIAPFTNFPF